MNFTRFFHCFALVLTCLLATIASPNVYVENLGDFHTFSTSESTQPPLHVFRLPNSPVSNVVVGSQVISFDQYGIRVSNHILQFVEREERKVAYSIVAVDSLTTSALYANKEVTMLAVARQYLDSSGSVISIFIVSINGTYSLFSQILTNSSVRAIQLYVDYEGNLLVAAAQRTFNCTEEWESECGLSLVYKVDGFTGDAEIHDAFQTGNATNVKVVTDENSNSISLLYSTCATMHNGWQTCRILNNLQRPGVHSLNFMGELACDPTAGHFFSLNGQSYYLGTKPTCDGSQISLWTGQLNFVNVYNTFSIMPERWFVFGASEKYCDASLVLAAVGTEGTTIYGLDSLGETHTTMYQDPNLQIAVMWASGDYLYCVNQSAESLTLLRLSCPKHFPVQSTTYPTTTTTVEITTTPQTTSTATTTTEKVPTRSKTDLAKESSPSATWTLPSRSSRPVSNGYVENGTIISGPYSESTTEQTVLYRSLSLVPIKDTAAPHKVFNTSTGTGHRGTTSTESRTTFTTKRLTTDTTKRLTPADKKTSAASETPQSSMVAKSSTGSQSELTTTRTSKPVAITKMETPRTSHSLLNPSSPKTVEPHSTDGNTVKPVFHSDSNKGEKQVNRTVPTTKTLYISTPKVTEKPPNAKLEVLTIQKPKTLPVKDVQQEVTSKAPEVRIYVGRAPVILQSKSEVTGGSALSAAYFRVPLDLESNFTSVVNTKAGSMVIIPPSQDHLCYRSAFLTIGLAAVQTAAKTQFCNPAAANLSRLSIYESKAAAQFGSGNFFIASLYESTIEFVAVLKGQEALFDVHRNTSDVRYSSVAVQICEGYPTACAIVKTCPYGRECSAELRCYRMAKFMWSAIFNVSVPEDAVLHMETYSRSDRCVLIAETPIYRPWTAPVSSTLTVYRLKSSSKGAKILVTSKEQLEICVPPGSLRVVNVKRNIWLTTAMKDKAGTCVHGIYEYLSGEKETSGEALKLVRQLDRKDEGQVYTVMGKDVPACVPRGDVLLISTAGKAEALLVDKTGQAGVSLRPMSYRNLPGNLFGQLKFVTIANHTFFMSVSGTQAITFNVICVN